MNQEQNTGLAQQSIDTALRKLADRKASEALQELSNINEVVQDLEHVRALCFIALEQIENAHRSLQKEISTFPSNHSAQELLLQVSRELDRKAFLENPPQEFDEIFNFCSQFSRVDKAHSANLYCRSKEICEKNLPGNFLELGLCDGSAILLALVVARYSKMPRWVYVCDGGFGNALSSADLKTIALKIGVQDLVKPLDGDIRSITRLQQEWVGMLSLVHIGEEAQSIVEQLLTSYYGTLVEEGVVHIDSLSESQQTDLQKIVENPKIQIIYHAITEQSGWFQRTEPFTINESISSVAIEEFNQDDVVKHGVVSQMSMNERFQLYYTTRHVVKAIEDTVRFIEVGSFAGGSLLLSYFGFKRQNKGVQGYAVEPFGEAQFYNILAGIQSEVTHLKMFSSPASKVIGEAYSAQNILADFILIDGDHSYEGVRQDIIDYYPLLRPGGIMLFHDYLPQLNEANMPSIYFHHGDKEPGIRQAVNELMEAQFKAEYIPLPLLRPTDKTQTQAHLPIIPEVFSTIRIYRKPV